MSRGKVKIPDDRVGRGSGKALAWFIRWLGGAK